MIYNKTNRIKGWEKDLKKVNSHYSHGLVNWREDRSHASTGVNSKFVTSLCPLSLLPLCYNVLALFFFFNSQVSWSISSNKSLCFVLPNANTLVSGIQKQGSIHTTHTSHVYIHTSYCKKKSIERNFYNNIIYLLNRTWLF